MRAVVQRVVRGSVTVGNKIAGEIGQGVVVLLGVGRGDTVAGAAYLADKIANLRVFEDAGSKMNLSVKDVGGEVLSVSQFTIYGDCRKGRRPNFFEAASPEEARCLYEIFNGELEKLGLRVAKGCFREHMVVEIINDGPVTILLDSNKIF
ncbi:MAG: D-tyrosyl-tRNA(Tyr) deacylase [Pelotomaculum sp. PtaB.Bin013]|uniref:D-aminoacyl-tRNA deacylase n=1 Tax=Pelotomaculum isophthalicicum JI TaxID=947010 RepID=A0A9X4H761_9FIRM|nr:D-aminoacyl-tRNA deacylase [Pelotomaculum isophthalicicum]MDF9407459.1 D-aminoacyl-tRNA deacylase [Pelotomaculum isophthalicicum JI]OPX89375.1 MAG: D-tyrosyl-tRNA(Tyr) deacylase [Pelotomaculum sp. PtaB.Bin013]